MNGRCHDCRGFVFSEASRCDPCAAKHRKNNAKFAAKNKDYYQQWRKDHSEEEAKKKRDARLVNKLGRQVHDIGSTYPPR